MKKKFNSGAATKLGGTAVAKFGGTAVAKFGGAADIKFSGIVVAKFGGSAVVNKNGLNSLKNFILSNAKQKIIIISAAGKKNGEDKKLTDLLLDLYALTIKQKNLAEQKVLATRENLASTKNFANQKNSNLTRELFKTKSAVIKKLAELIYFAFNTSFNIALKKAENLYEKTLNEKSILKNGLDYCVSRGEYLTCKILCSAFNGNFLSAERVFYISRTDNNTDNGRNNSANKGADNSAGNKADNILRADKLKINLKKSRAALLNALETTPPQRKFRADLTRRTQRKPLDANSAEQRKPLFITGFYGNYGGKIKLFPRGGGDLSGALAAACSHAELYKNYTDVCGIKNAPPDIIKNAKTFKRVCYADLKRLIFSGAGVLSRESAELICNKKIKTQILSAVAAENSPKTLTSKKRKCVFKAICVKLEQENAVITMLGKSFKSKKFRKTAAALLKKANLAPLNITYDKNGARICTKQANAENTVKLLYYRFIKKRLVA